MGEGLINTQYYREAAVHFEKYGRYEDGEPDSYQWIDYWDREHDRVENGYSVGGIPITGLHYLYLNYLPIKKITQVTDLVLPGLHKEAPKHSKKQGDRGLALPSFWDEDFVIFHTWDIAKNGISFENLEILNKKVTIPLVLTPENLSGGHHHLWLKPRGVGASWKGAAIPIKRQFFGTDNSTFIVADQKQYLLKDGIYDKYLTYRNRLIKYSDTNKNGECVSGFARNFSLTGTKDMEYRASYWAKDKQGNSIEKGQMTSVYGVIVNGDENNMRGKRGTIIFEEFGSFPKVDKSWEIAQSSVEEDGVVFDTMYGFGTGGDTGSGIDSLTKMFYDPIAYNLLQFTNKWDEHFFERTCAYFTTATKSISYRDFEGNSLQEEAKSYLEAQREIKTKADDPSLLPAYQSDKPFTPQEALLNSVNNIFPVTLLLEHLNYLLSSGLYRDLVTKGDLTRVGRVVKFTPNPLKIPFEDYPVPKNTTKDGAVCILHNPFKSNGITPDNLYRVSVDPYRHDTSTGDSVGSIIVIENPNKLTSYKGDKIVAWYTGRPKTQDEFNEIVYGLGILYNGKIAIENDETGDIIGFGKRHKLLDLLEEQFELAYDEQLKTKDGMTRKFGMHIASGKHDLRKKQGDKYIQEWLLKPRSIGEDGKIALTLHTIYDIGLLKELIKYRDDANFDRVSSLRINMYHEREFVYQNRTIQLTRKKQNMFFSKKLYQ